MATLFKRVLFFLIAASLVRAAPAMSVPLASAIDRPATTSYGSDDGLANQQETTDPSGGQYSPFRRVGGGSDGSDAEVRIVKSEVLAYGPQPDKAEVRASYPEYGVGGQAAMRGTGSKGSPGWVKPVVGIGAGSSLYALFAHKGKGGGNGGNGLNGKLGGNSGGNDPPPSIGSGGGDTPPSAIPEPGTMLLMGIGIAGYLGGRKIVKK